MKRLFPLFLIIFLAIPFMMLAQQPKDLGRMTIYENHFYNEILRALRADKTDGKLIFQAIPSNIEIPKELREFEMVWTNIPVSQGRTGTCWDYSALSFMESEVFRITGRGMKLSEMYIVYYEYLSKAEEFIESKGKSRFTEGSEANAVTRQMKTHGIVPVIAYSGNPKSTLFPDHKNMVKSMKGLLQSYKQNELWDKELILSGIQSILNNYLGEPPKEFVFEGVKHTPITFMNEVARLNPDDYVSFMSLKSEAYWSKAEYKVPDNYWHSKEYYNLPLDDFMALIKKAIKEGYSMAIGGDVSESGYLPQYDAAFVPSYDIPSDYIDENARQFRFSNRSTTDDHGVHLMGFKEGKENEKWWFLIKDSSSSSFNGKNKGYYFYHEDYIKLKMMNVLLHREVVEEVLNKF